MRQRSTATIVIILGCALIGPAGAQQPAADPNPKADWTVVEDLPGGVVITVKTTDPVRCVLREATDTELVCDRFPHPAPSSFPFPPPPYTPPPQSLRTYVFRRDAVRQVRLEHDEVDNAASTVLGAMLGTAIGGAVGYNVGATSKNVGGAFLLGGLGALVGGFVGHNFPLLHGRVIYQR